MDKKVFILMKSKRDLKENKKIRKKIREINDDDVIAIAAALKNNSTVKKL